VLGPGSFFGSVVAPLGAPRLQAAVRSSPGRRVLVHNLFSVASVGERLATLAGHGVDVDVVVVQVGTPDLGDTGGVEVVEADVARPNGLAHDTGLLGEVLRELAERRSGGRATAREPDADGVRGRSPRAGTAL
jgi:2-phospho-L-lactate transferase/gluconeogenesis factor (CofD/UPF0052 family)